MNGNPPFGSVLVNAAGEIVLEAENDMLTTGDVTGHAEINLIRAAGRELGPALGGYTLYTSCEPCAMCAGAMVNARVERLVFGARDPKGGYCGSVGDVVREPRLNHQIAVCSGVLAEESSALLRAFFRRLRSSGLFV